MSNFMELRGLRLAKTEEGIRVSNILLRLTYTNNTVMKYREKAYCDLTDKGRLNGSVLDSWVDLCSDVLLRA